MLTSQMVLDAQQIQVTWTKFLGGQCENKTSFLLDSVTSIEKFIHPQKYCNF